MSGTYEPDLYDVITPEEVLGDTTWYCRKSIESGGPVLELGAGTGRITLAIAKAGIEVHALDTHGGMLERLKTKLSALDSDVKSRVNLVEATMTDFHLNDRFALIIAPYRAFLHNITTEQQLACLQLIRTHLRPHGHFTFNVFHPSLSVMAKMEGPFRGIWRLDGIYPLPDGGSVLLSETTSYNTVKQVLHSQHRYEVYDATGTLTRTFLHSLELAYLYPGDIRRLLEKAGFNNIKISGNFEGCPFREDGDELVVEANIER